MKMRAISAITIYALLCAGARAGEPVVSSKYAPFTVVVYNKNADDSRKLAAYYAGKRAIPLENIIGLDCPTGEEISREEFDKSIRDPLRARFDAEGWWEREDDGTGTLRPTRNKMKFLALMYGMPLKIKRAPAAPTGKTDPATGKPVPPPAANHGNNDGASVDSELLLLGVDQKQFAGSARNPYFRSADAFGHKELLLTARIDGPDIATAKRMVDDALAAEAGGLWGIAAVDVANLAATKGPGYRTGDDWLENCAGFYHKAGIPVVVDRLPARFPAGYPFGDDVVLYFGWYTSNAEGPFADREFKFKPGAVACHLHSYSAKTLRTTAAAWAGPLLARGACATLGNVYEPFLTMSLHFDLFNARLLGGFTLAEAGWMATPSASWMTVVVGDPLYQPFRRGQSFAKEPDADLKAFRVAVRQWGAKPDELKTNVARAAGKLGSARLLEALGLHLLAAKDYDGAKEQFAAARAKSTAPADKLRQDLHSARATLESGDKAGAIKALRTAAVQFKAIPEAKAAVSIANQLDPPPPPPPKPAAP